MKTPLRILGSLGLASAVMPACVPPKDVPAKPSWYQDVQPLVLGNCASCHGSRVRDKAGDVVGPAGAGQRYDIYDPEDFLEALTGDVAGYKAALELADDNAPEKKTAIFIASSVGSGGVVSASWKLYLDPSAEANKKAADYQNRRMPPPPALELPDFERNTILNWIKNAEKNPDMKPLKGTRPGNAKPKATVVSRTAKAGNLVVTFDVSDGDGDTVMGRIEGGTEKRPFFNAGRHTITLPGLDSKAALKVVATDGLDKVEITLK